MHRFHMERFNLNKLNKVDGKEQYHVEISYTFSALENLIREVDINRAWETENIKISAKESLILYCSILLHLSLSVKYLFTVSHATLMSYKILYTIKK
jgi:hypothetical protein